MKITRNNYTNSIETIENDTFLWKKWAPGYLEYKPTNQTIYQMDWYEDRNSKPIEDQAIIAQVIKFREVVDNILHTHTQNTTISMRDAEPKHGENGYCRKCHSYCWGDCEAQ